MFKNMFKTVILLTVLGVFFIFVGSFFGEIGLIIGLVVALLFVGGSYWFSDKLAVRAAGANPVTMEEAPELYAIVQELAYDADIPMPRLYISPDAQPNAFATGRSPKKAVVCVTAGILQALDRDELRAVLAHEMAHVRNRDILITSVAAAVALAITFIARIAMWGAVFSGGDDEGGNIVGVLLLAILAPIAALIIQMALSRSREFEADRTGAELIHDGEALARALQKIEAYSKQVPMDVDPAHATAYIINPLSGRKVQFSSLFRTHPPTEQRIERLRSQQFTS